jgi:hypothetical protein
MQSDPAARSSSKHTINADFELTRKLKVSYFVLNLLSNLHSKYKTSEFLLRKFNPRDETLSSALMDISEPTSPSRIMCNMFWNDLDWSLMAQNLKGPLKVIEVGCGSGRYGLMLDGLSSINSYLGVDIKDSHDWHQNSSKMISFQIGSYEDFATHATDQNLIITQSALEHFNGDLDFFSSIGQYANSKNFPVLSIHLFPSTVGLFTFLLHGIRQYNRRTISDLVSIAKPQGPGTLYALGGWRSNFAHFTRITLKSLIFRKSLSANEVVSFLSKVRSAIRRDCESSSCLFPSFYALVISWNCDSPDLEWVIRAKPNL